jgi:hypothetical protein
MPHVFLVHRVPNCLHNTEYLYFMMVIVEVPCLKEETTSDNKSTEILTNIPQR